MLKQAERDRRSETAYLFVGAQTVKALACGDQFDFRRFNDALVLGGSVPMSVLTRVIDDYIAKEKAR